MDYKDTSSFRPHWSVAARLWPCSCDYCMRAHRVIDQELLNSSGLTPEQKDRAGLMIDRAFEGEGSR